ncbi:MAG: VWA domain-containing protein [gamma proteobacterium endosymbiont of Lamellibrachia anaximandri]|nr:VWA domain-containing protein [gamma proteobacterium endosymbiont of Lamellibrachia anaximandri]
MIEGLFHRLPPLFGYPLVVLFLLLAWWNPDLLPTDEPLDLLLVMDESTSVGSQFPDQSWQRLGRLLADLPANSRFSLIRFADRPQTEITWKPISDNELQHQLQQPAPPRTLSLDNHISAIGTALRQGTNQLVPSHRSAILLLSDGRENSDTSPPALPDAGGNIALFWSKPPARYAAGHPVIDSINLPERVKPAMTFPVSIAITSPTAGESQLIAKLDGHQLTEKPLRFTAQSTTVHHLQLSATTAGPHLLELTILDQGGDPLDSRQGYFEVVRKHQLLYISHQPPSLPVQQLQQSGWEITRLSPRQLNARPDSFKDTSLVLIDDIPADDLAPETVTALTGAVEQQGVGLIVLGGPNAFGSGAYRHSALEHLLPVEAESARPEAAAAFLFLVDKSGSMDSATLPQSRLATAFRAVTESAGSLRAGDHVGLIAFDREIQPLLPLQAYADPLSTLNHRWEVSPSGGTRLTPALTAAIGRLAAAAPKKRFLILVTDGFVEGEAIEPLIGKMQAADIKLIALAVGEDADLSVLQQLATATSGQVLQVAETAELPRFMRHELEQQRQSWQPAAVKTQSVAPMPFSIPKETAWLPVNGYQVTRTKPDSTTYLATPNGDPLLAVRQMAAGRVAALPGGLLRAVDNTHFTQSLLAWLDRQGHNPHLKIDYRSAAGELQVKIDALDRKGHWSDARVAELILETPAGIRRQHQLTLSAPGRFEANIKTPLSGLYQAWARVGNERTHRLLQQIRNSESIETPVIPWLQAGVDQGSIRNGSKTAFMEFLESSSKRSPSRKIWLLLALFLFFSIVLHERRAGIFAALPQKNGGDHNESS